MIAYKSLFNFLKEPENGRAVLGIDGRCASGKTTFSAHLESIFPSSIVHIDDFFLPHNLQKDALGGNIDRERFFSEVLLNLRNDAPFFYSVFDCKFQRFSDKRKIDPKNLVIIEGVYSLLPEFIPYYDIKIFMDIDPNLQKKRLISREGARADMFFKKWIPLEESYFNTFNSRKTADIILSEYAGINE
ncbi:MAG: uridine kinase [Clostridia bacterium]